MVEQYFEANHEAPIEAREFGESQLKRLASITDPEKARAAIEAASNLDNTLYTARQTPIRSLFQLTDLQGHRLYLSPEAKNVKMDGYPLGMSNQVIGGNSFSVFTGKVGPWVLVHAVERWEFLWTLHAFGSDMSFYMLLEFPFLLIPIWFAVLRGLSPLKLLAATIAAKGENDLRPINVDARYAELKPLTAALDGLMAQLRGKIDREHAFVQDAAHELRTPMAVISAQAHVLALADTPQARLEAEQRLDLAIARASHLIQQLLQLANVDGQRPVESEALDLAQVVRQQMADAVPTAMARRIELSLDAPDSLPGRLERDAFQSILQNLLDNALRYVQQGGQVVVELLRRDNFYVLAVADNGPGIAEQERSKVFERFYRGTGHDVSGSGLGLAIVKQAAERLGGKVALSGGLGGDGCSFAVSIPIA